VTGTFEDCLDIRPGRKFKDGITCSLRLQPWMFNGAGVLHGGVLASVADEVAWHAIRAAYSQRASMTTSELKVDYLRPVRGSRLSARGYVLKIGRMLCVTRVEIFDQNRALAVHATVTYAMLPGAPPLQ
jgi:uncharacterized protein (TIGR00369 family)